MTCIQFWFLLLGYLKQDPSPQQLAKNTADRPDVYWVGVMFGAEEDFRCSVVLGHNFLGHSLAGVIFLHPEKRNFLIL